MSPTPRLKPGGGSPLRHFYVFRPRRSLAAAMLSVALPGAVIVIAHLEGNLVNDALELDLRRDLGFFAQYFVLLPATLLGMGMLVGGLPIKLLEWTQAGHFAARPEHYTDVISWANRRFASPLTRGAPVVIAVAALVYGAYVHTFSSRDTWHSPADAPLGTVAGWAILPVRLLLYFGVADFAVRAAISIWAYTRLVRLGLHVRVLHADSCGGLSSLGKYWMGMYVSVLAVGLLFWLLVYAIQVTVWQGRASYVLVLAAYCLAILLGLIPLLVTHRAMVNERRKWLAPVDEMIGTTMKILMVNKFGAQETMELERLFKIRAVIEKMAVWPYNFRLFSVFTASVIPGLISLGKMYQTISPLLPTW